MKIETFYYTKKDGWSIKNFPEMDSENTLVLLFCDPEYINDPTPIDQIAKSYPKSKIMGCSTAGVIFDSNILDGIISVAVLRFEKTQLEISQHSIESAEDSLRVGKEITQKLLKPELRGIFILSEGTKINGTDLVKGMAEATPLNKNIIITGGLAGDGIHFKKTWVIYQGKILLNAVVAVGFYGDHIQIGHAAYGGWDIFGPERVITRSDKNTLYELNEQPALELYKRYLGEKAAGLPSTGLLYPLAIRKNSDDQHILVRTILGVDEKEQSLTFAGEMPLGYSAQLMRANFDRLIMSAGEAGVAARKMITSKETNDPNHVISIAVSCVGRRLILGERTEEETESVLESLPPGTKQIGYYSYGEISPFSDGTCDLHNQTMALTLLYES